MNYGEEYHDYGWKQYGKELNPFFKSQQDLHRTIPIDYKIDMNV